MYRVISCNRELDRSWGDEHVDHVEDNDSSIAIAHATGAFVIQVCKCMKMHFYVFNGKIYVLCGYFDGVMCNLSMHTSIILISYSISLLIYRIHLSIYLSLSLSLLQP